MPSATIDELKRLAAGKLAMVGDGEPLDGLERSLVEFGLAVSVTSLDRAAIDRSIGEAFRQGAFAEQIQEIASLVSGLGVHSLMASSAAIAAAASERGQPVAIDLDPLRQDLWDRHVAGDVYWTNFATAVPGFLEALIRLSPDQFEAFFAFCAIPWKTRAVRARTKELVALACDATPAHRFVPGFLLHLDNAIAIGVGRRAIFETLDLAEQAPAHRGFA